MGEGSAGRIALVTGGATGIGRVIALTFARAGATVIIADVDERGMEETVRLITATGGVAHAVAADVTRAAVVETWLTHITATWGRLDCACNNAGMADGAPTWLDVTEDAWERVLALNLTGVWSCMRAEIRQMLTQGRGSIVNMASIFGLGGSPTSPALTASTHGVIGLTKSAAVAYAQAGIRINAVCPAFIDSPMLDRLFRQYPEHKAPIVARHPMGRLGTAEEVAAAVVWLCSDAAAFITGQALAVDGGSVVQSARGGRFCVSFVRSPVYHTCRDALYRIPSVPGGRVHGLLCHAGSGPGPATPAETRDLQCPQAAVRPRRCLPARPERRAHCGAARGRG